MRADGVSEETIARFIAEEMEEDELRRGKGVTEIEALREWRKTPEHIRKLLLANAFCHNCGTTEFAPGYTLRIRHGCVSAGDHSWLASPSARAANHISSRRNTSLRIADTSCDEKISCAPFLLTSESLNSRITYHRSFGCSLASSSSQVQHHLLLGQQVVATRHLGKAGEARGHHGAVMPAMNTLFELRAERRTLRARADKGHPFCQDEKTLKAPICWIIGLICRFLYCQLHCGQRIAPANRGYRFAHNKNARRRFEGSGRARRRPLSPKRNRPIGANSQWDDSPQAARGYMNFDNRSRQMQPCARIGRRKATPLR